MRASSDVNDSGFRNLSRYKYIYVYLDGKIVNEPITADEELGYVKYRACGFDGHLITHEVNGDQQLLTLEKYGKVSIKVSNRLTRLSVEENDPGYCVEAHTSNVTIFLDGEVIPLVVTADSNEGYVKYLARGSDGQRLTLERYGKVRIEILQ